MLLYTVHQAYNYIFNRDVGCAWTCWQLIGRQKALDLVLESVNDLIQCFKY